MVGSSQSSVLDQVNPDHHLQSKTGEASAEDRVQSPSFLRVPTGGRAGRPKVSPPDGPVARGLWLLRTCWKSGVPDRVLYFGDSLGDNFLLTCLARELQLRNESRTWIASNAVQVSELLAGNPDIAAVAPWNKLLRRFARLCRIPVNRLRYQERDMNHEKPTVPDGHIVAVMCRQAGITGKVSIRPYLNLSQKESEFGRIAHRQIAIMSTGLSAKYPIPNKEWSAAGFQEVVNRLSGEICFVQLGTAADPLLNGTVDLRGQLDLRQVAGILKHSDLFVGQAGLLMHLARAVECRSVIVFGGYEAPCTGGYPCNRNLFTLIPCAPCYQPYTCAFDRICMAAITPEMVVGAIREELHRPQRPLEVDEVVL